MLDLDKCKYPEGNSICHSPRTIATGYLLLRNSCKKQPVLIFSKFIRKYFKKDLFLKILKMWLLIPAILNLQKPNKWQFLSQGLE